MTMPMTAAERVARAERWIAARRLSGGALRVLGAVAVIALVYVRGVGDGRAKERAAHVVAALDSNAHALAVAGKHRDSTKTIAVAAVHKSDVQRVKTEAARAHVAIVSDSEVSIDRLPPVVVPMPVIQLIRATDTQAALDTTTILALRADVRALEVRDSLHLARDSLRIEQLSIEGNRKFWLGAKVGAGAVIVIRGVIWFVAHR